MAAGPVLEVDGLRKRYGGLVALADASLTVLPGEIHGLVGQNGAGKSTLIKVLAGAVQPDAGSIAIDGASVGSLDERLSQELGLRFVHQDPSLVPRITVTENLFLGKRLPSRAGLVSWRTAHASAIRIVRGFADVDVTRRADRLSMSEQSMVAIARAADSTARCVILDEPTAALADREVQVVLNAARRLSEQGIAVVFVSHRLSEVLEVAHRVTVMRDGRTVGVHDTASLDRDRLVTLILGEEGPTPPKIAASIGSSRTAALSPVLEVHAMTGGPLREVSLAVRPGEIVGVAGLAGSGRSSLLLQLLRCVQIQIGPSARRRQQFAGRVAVGVRTPGRSTGPRGPPSSWLANASKCTGEHHSDGPARPPSLPAPGHPESAQREGRNRETNFSAPD